MSPQTDYFPSFKNGDFVKMRTTFLKLKSGPQRALTTVPQPDALKPLRELYLLLPRGEQGWRQWLRVVFFIPHVGHLSDAPSVPRLLGRNPDVQARVFERLIAADYPHDLSMLRELCQRFQVETDWNSFGTQLFYWGPDVKNRFLGDYYLGTTERS